MSLLREAEKFIGNQKTYKALNAFISKTKDDVGLLSRVREAHNRAEAGQSWSPLDGKIIAIKDNICTTALPTTCASRMLKDYTSPYDATVIKKLEAAGALIVGKTGMDEFGMGSHSMNSFFDDVKNPRGNGQASAGGSSGGSAVAVATEQCIAAIGTDTGGSVRLPAAYTGVVGFKPSYGMVSRCGIVAYANSLDTVGILATKCDIIKSVFDAINGYDKRDPTSISNETRSRITDLSAARNKGHRLRIGVPIEYNVQELSSSIRNAWVNTLRQLDTQGHCIRKVSLSTTRNALSAYYVLAPAEASSNLAKYDGVRYGTREDEDDTSGGVLFAGTRGKNFGEEVKRRILLGTYSLSAEAIDNYFLQAQAVRRCVQDDFNSVFALANPLQDRRPHNEGALEGVDVLICPTTLSEPPSRKEVKSQSTLQAYMNDVFTVPASLAGLPALTVPVALKQDGVDNSTIGTTGIQLIAQYGDDQLLFDLAKVIEELGLGRNNRS